MSNHSLNPPLSLNPPFVILGLWPLAGVTTVGVTDRDRHDTMEAAIDGGIRCFDTAFAYGVDGISDKLLGEYVRAERQKYFVIGKVGQRYDDNGKRYADGSAPTLRGDAETSLQRLGIEQFDALMLHQPDPNTPIQESAEAMAKICDDGIARQTGICNADVTQIRQFRSSFGNDADKVRFVQHPLNLLQKDTHQNCLQSLQDLGMEAHVYWTLMKGLLAGKISRDHVFAPGDSRPGYEIFQGAARERAHRVVDRLVQIGNAFEMTVAQQSIGWAMSQPRVHGVLVGARKSDQVREIARSTKLSAEHLQQIETMLDETLDLR